jgi:hypothetical protein
VRARERERERERLIYFSKRIIAQQEQPGREETTTSIATGRGRTIMFIRVKPAFVLSPFVGGGEKGGKEKQTKEVWQEK